MVDRRARGWRGREPVRTASAVIALVLRPEHLRRTALIALCIGIVLNSINQAGVIAGGDATAATWLRVALNFGVPFCVSNAGLVAGHWEEVTRRH